VPTTKSARKRMRQSEKQRQRNASFKSKLRTHRRRLVRAIGEERKEDSQNLLRELVSLYDKGVKKGIYKRNTVARQKSAFTKKVNALPGAAAPQPEEQAASGAT
jgi:small subunit ribosomal protein S20